MPSTTPTDRQSLNRLAGIPTASEEALQPPRLTPMSLLPMLLGIGKGAISEETIQDLVKDIPILLKPNQIAPRNVEDVLKLAKSPVSTAQMSSAPWSKRSPLTPALEALSRRYPRLTKQAVEDWGQDFLPAHVLAETRDLAGKLQAMIRINPMSPLSVEPTYNLSVSRPEPFYALLEHELTHAAQNWLIKRGLGKSFKVGAEEFSGDATKALEPPAYLREIQRTADFGGQREVNPHIEELLKEYLKSKAK